MNKLFFFIIFALSCSKHVPLPTMENLEPEMMSFEQAAKELEPFPEDVVIYRLTLNDSTYYYYYYENFEDDPYKESLKVIRVDLYIEREVFDTLLFYNMVSQQGWEILEKSVGSVGSRFDLIGKGQTRFHVDIYRQKHKPIWVAHFMWPFNRQEWEDKKVKSLIQ